MITLDLKRSLSDVGGIPIYAGDGRWLVAYELIGVIADEWIGMPSDPRAVILHRVMNEIRLRLVAEFPDRVPGFGERVPRVAGFVSRSSHMQKAGVEIWLTSDLQSDGRGFTPDPVETNTVGQIAAAIRDAYSDTVIYAESQAKRGRVSQ